MHCTGNIFHMISRKIEDGERKYTLPLKIVFFYEEKDEIVAFPIFGKRKDDIFSTVYDHLVTQIAHVAMCRGELAVEVVVRS